MVKVVMEEVVLCIGIVIFFLSLLYRGLICACISIQSAIYEKILFTVYGRRKYNLQFKESHLCFIAN
jgi:hypothetical protein